MRQIRVSDKVYRIRYRLSVVFMTVLLLEECNIC